MNATKEFYPAQTLVACLELHTYSSLKREFLDHYQNTLDKADEAYVFFNPLTVEHKRLEMIHKEDVLTAFNKQGLQVFIEKTELVNELHAKNWQNSVLLLMSSGNFSGIDFKTLTEKILSSV